MGAGCIAVKWVKNRQWQTRTAGHYSGRGRSDRSIGILEEEEVILLRQIGNSWARIAQMFGVSLSTVTRRAATLGMSDVNNYTLIELVNLLRWILVINLTLRELGMKVNQILTFEWGFVAALFWICHVACEHTSFSLQTWTVLVSKIADGTLRERQTYSYS